MSGPDLPDRIKATLTIDLDFAKADQPLIGGVLQDILGNLSISANGRGSINRDSHYSYKLTSNLPPVPMTMDRLFELFDAQREEGEPTAAERLQDSMRPDYEQAVEWWQGLNGAQQGWFLEAHKGTNTFTKAWDIYQAFSPSERVAFDILRVAD
ncbi:hypothetical protein IB275_30480 [Pseudomonas sp. PDM21]|uniref:hypothetical protein n=1 Tax=Pseudomonas sp. PDM21 TaxID=2769257 RepID=UPI0017848ABB|nr:hypothetical protein [Pseudomonas sp. PDM21]MBD9674943.1 hypothetical protein [Pseudomonas sp. PDM21]